MRRMITESDVEKLDGIADPKDAQAQTVLMSDGNGGTTWALSAQINIQTKTSRNNSLNFSPNSAKTEYTALLPTSSLGVPSNGHMISYYPYGYDNTRILAGDIIVKDVSDSNIIFACSPTAYEKLSGGSVFVYSRFTYYTA